MRKEEERYEESTLMEGMVSFRSVMKTIESGASDRKIVSVLIDSERAKKNAGNISYIKAMSAKHSFPISFVSKEDIESVAIGNSHGGIIFYTSERTIPHLDPKYLKKNGFYVMVNGIEDPYNFGYALRSLYASGADGVILNKRNWMSASGVVCRSSAGASEEIDSFVAESDEEVVNVFKKSGYKIVSAQLENSSPVWESDLKKPLLLIVGGEKRGLSKIITDNSDSIVRIDYGREFKEALSAASASAILSFEVFRQNRK